MKCDNWLNKVLENREQRQTKQWELLEKFNSPVLSLTINIPGAKKDSEDARYIYEIALQEIQNLKIQEHQKILTCKETGYEALFCFKIDAKALKIFTCKIEENHPLGRFMDIDVIDTNKQILSRNIPRKCYVCEKSAKACARERRHSFEQLENFISQKVHDYKLSL